MVGVAKVNGDVAKQHCQAFVVAKQNVVVGRNASEFGELFLDIQKGSFYVCNGDGQYLSDVTNSELAVDDR
jgi:hypothetical protein